MSVLGDKTGHANIRHVILTFIILSGLAAAFLYYPPVPTRTAEELTQGDITFTDSSGNPISGAIGISGSGISGGYKENVNFIKWERVPNGLIYFDALAIENVSAKFRLARDSRNSNVIIENYGSVMPEDMDEQVPGIPVKYVRVSAFNLSFVEAEISIGYNSSELKNIDEISLSIYHYDTSKKAWTRLKTRTDVKEDLLTASVSSLSIFAVSAKQQGQIDIHDTGSTHIRSDIRTYDDAKNLKRSGKSSSFTAQDIPPGGDLEVDALDSRNVALRLKVNEAAGGGDVILEDYGRKNPVSVPLPGKSIKFVEIGVEGISFSSADVSVRYREAELNGVSENSLVIYHWNLTYWEALDTTVDEVNNILKARTTTLSPFAVSGSIAGPDRILVAANRYVILDDPRKPAGANASTEQGFSLPLQNDYTSWAFFSGNSTRINASALYMDDNGRPVSGRIISFTLYLPNGTALTTLNDTTNARGLANFSFDMDSMNYYGNWQIKAGNGSTSDNTSFIYNWWGCSFTASPCNQNHNSNSPPEGSTINSPYTGGRDSTTGSNAAHSDPATNCTFCHQSYDGRPGDTNPLATGDTNHLNATSDVHKGISCNNASCHGTYTTHNSNQLIYSCFNSNCHVNRSDISNKSTLNSATVSTARSLYSANNGSSFNATFHTPDSTVPCFICHGPMHNVTKPDRAQQFVRNYDTESSQCIKCHSGYSNHNGSVNCTLCHSSDAHYIQVFGGATYVLTNSPAKGDCTTCHQNSTFLDALKSIPRAGNYTGRNPPQVPSPVVHSDDSTNGSKWNQTDPYWTNTSQIERCKYCHGETMHKVNALGRPSLFGGGNPVNGTVSITLTWCQQCHWEGSPDYAIMATTFNEDNMTVPPEITGNATYGNVTAGDGTSYVNHTSYAKDDAKCRSCHGAGSENITGFMHAVAVGISGGVNCIDCHNTGGEGNNVNFTALDRGMHAIINSGAVSTPANASNRPCWGCHGTKNGTWANESDQPVSEHNTSVYNNPRRCYDCHSDTMALFGAGNVTDHIPSGISPYTDVNTSSYGKIYCSYCHNNSLIQGYDVSMGVSGGSPVNASVSHYGANRTAGMMMSPASNSTECVFCHRNSTNMQKWGIIPGSRANISNKNASGGGTDHSTYTISSSCPACHGNYAVAGGFTFHNSSLGSGTAGGGNSDCVGCHDTGGAATNEINATAMRLGNHRNLNRNAANSTPADPINKACWACHGYGTDPGGHSQNNSNPGDYRNPWKCVDCHSRYPNFTSANLTLMAEITGRKTIDHIQQSHAESIYSDAYNPAVNCTTCHNKSLVSFTDSVTPADKIASNVSHYSDYSGLLSPSTNCSLCHQSPTNAALWYANLTRHPAKNQNYTFCTNCHNSTNIVTFHSQPLVWTPTIHGFQGNRAFDWENDDASGGAAGSLPENDESCAACHSGSQRRTCENCHMPNTTSLFTGPFNPGGVMRSDINDTLPYVYAHINYSDITGTGVDVPDQNNPVFPTSCFYYNTGTNAGTCHGNSYFNRTPAGGYYAFRGLSAVRNVSDPAHRTKTIDRLPDTTDCLFCHAQGSASIRYAWGSPFQVNASNMFGNRYSVTGNDSCYLCHTRDSTKPADFHSSSVVSGGGPGCLGCHNTSSPQNFTGMHYIDGRNFSRSAHANMNSDNASGYGINASCWACHNSSGTVVPDNTHPDRKTAPYTCVDCHLGNGTRAGAYNASIVYNHFRNGTPIRVMANRTDDLVSCIECHENISGMILPNNDNDTGSFSGDTISVTGGRTSTYHYGESKLSFGEEKGSDGYCSYCHRNATGEFNRTFMYPSNSSISNHSMGYASNPSCSAGQCHNSTGTTLHGINLTIPLTGYSSPYCLSCHGSNDTGMVNYSGITTGTKSRHNNSVNCEECHMIDGKDIHPVRYLTRSGWNTSSTNAVNCKDCHQSILSSNFSTAAMIPSPLKHSSNTSNGSIWGTYWMSENGSCYYCHDNTKHSSTPLGRIRNLLSDPNNTRNGDLAATTWCADCHYNGAPYYNGSQWVPVPPLINVNNTGKTGWVNHSTYLSTGFRDTNCKLCHALNGSYTATSLNYSHSLNVGVSGGPNCTQCHNTGGPAGQGRLVNFSAMNASNAIHSNLNINAPSPGGYSSENRKCWACHGTGSEPAPGEHPLRYNTPYNCEDCHIEGAGQNRNFTPAVILNVSRHYGNATGIRTSAAVSCYSCHNTSEMMTGSFDPDGAANVYGGTNGGNTSVSHYGKKRTDYPQQGTNEYCNRCHNNASALSVFPYIDPANAAIANHSTSYNSTNPGCSSCHSSGRLHNSTLFKSSITTWPNSSYCASCHGPAGSASTKNMDPHNSTVNCTSCHMNSSRSIHGVSYLQTNLTWNTARSNAVNCTDCHQKNLTGFENAPGIPGILKHSSAPSNGSLWNSTPTPYWTSGNSPCYYCHSNTKHNNSGLGSIATMLSNPNNIRNGLLTNTEWCAGCHYNDPANTYYKGDLLNPVPPVITLNNTGKTGWVNHSTYLSTGFKDTNCKLCHALNGSYTATSLNYSHSLNVGVSGGPDCISCHNAGGPAGQGRLVNFSAMNASNAIHSNLNINAPSPGGFSSENKKCWACHGSGNEPAADSHPTGYDTPFTCEDCHIEGTGQNRNFTPSNILNVSRHYGNATGIRTAAAVSCYSCHNTSEMMTGSFDPDGAATVYGGTNGGNASSSHYGRKRPDYPQQGTNEYCYRCHNNASAPSVFPYSDPANATIANHSTNYNSTNPGCSVCHAAGRLHNSTLSKPTINTWPNSSYCNSCHGPGGSASTKNMNPHNSTVNCTSCHMNSSRNIHPVNYLQADLTWKTAKSNAVNCTDCHQNTLTGFGTAPRIPGILKHSNDPRNGSIWNSTSSPYWTSGNSPCYYCHDNTKHNNSGLGSIASLLLNPNNTRNGSLTATAWCADCHYNASINTNYKGNLWNPAPPLITVDNTGKTGWTNHNDYLTEGYRDADCRLCHALNGSFEATSLNYSHSLNTGISGGPNCTQCHNAGGSAGPGRLVNFNAMNGSNAIHSNLNINAPSPGGYPAENKKCWACHGTGSEPATGGHPSGYETPYTCEDCHIEGAGQNRNFTPSAILNVSRHYRNATGIRTSAAASCYSCHNTSEMMIGNIDPDGAASVYGGMNGGNTSVSHYGKKRSDYPQQGTNDYCYRCHNNASAPSVFPYTDPANATIANHSMNYNSTNPGCSSCHASGRLHNSTLSKPTIDTWPNSSYCITCHGAGGSAVIKNLNQHNGSVNCTSCHMNSSRNIHPVSYLQTNLTWNTAKSNAVNCTDCHQNTFTGFANAPRIPGILKHSYDPANGSLWNSSSSPYWTSGNSPCYYCHNNTKHNNSALGSIASLLSNPDNLRNGALAGTQWCADCHYNDPANAYYKGNQLNPAPPLVTVNNTGKTGWVNHTSYLTGGFRDANCKLCHALNGSYAATSLNYSHSLNVGVSGGPDCTQCHDAGGSAGPGRLVNFSAMNASGAIHSNLNINAPSPGGYPAGNKKCWACHGSGSEPAADNHPSRYDTPFTCEDCHIEGTGQNRNFTPSAILNVTQHYRNAAGIRTSAAASCYSCHNASEMMTGSFDPDGAGNVYGGTNGGNTSVSHYGKKRPDYPQQGTNEYCYRCHNNNSALSVFPYSDPSNATIANHSMNYNSTNPGCSSCHNTGRIHNGTLIKPSPVNSSFCLGCHGTTGTNATIKNLGKHNNTLDCTVCHINSTKDIHPVKYRQTDNTTFSTSRTNAIDCTICHQGAGFADAPVVRSPLAHSQNPYSGSLWGSYWQNTSQLSSCNYCHTNSSLHNASGLGRIEMVQYTNAKNQSLSGHWCASCHYNSSAYSNATYRYGGTAYSPVPPNISELKSLIASDGTAWFNHTLGNYADAKCNECHGSILSAPYSSKFVHEVSSGQGGSDCISCHDYSISSEPLNKKINVTAMRLGNHGNLNRNATNSSPTDPINKACWACHGFGTDPGGHSQNNSNPGDYRNPWKCVDCHSRYPNFTSSNQTLMNEITGRKTIDHIQQSHAESIYSDAYNPAVNCTTCHNKSMVSFRDSMTPTDPISANVSHYSDYSGLLSPSTNCTLCHRSPTNAATWYANLTRHPAKSQNYNFCANCHNSTNIITFHSQPLVWTPTIHGFQGNRAFDWENDDASGGATGSLPENDESCAACHSGSQRRTCENCHMPNTTSLFTGPFNPGGVMRSDINDTLPYVFAHINYSDITGTNVDVPNQNNPVFPTSCFYYNTGTNAGTCHGNSYFNSTPAGGYYAFRGLSAVRNVSDPAHRTKTIDRLPDTTNCLFCHAQGSASIRYTWGSPFQVNASNMFGNRYSVTGNDSCYLCHTRDSTKPVDFHSFTVVSGGGPGCLGCHNTSSPQNFTGMHYIDGGNFSRSVHANMNSNNASGYGINASCWACHNSTGTVVPENMHPDRKTMPYTCVDCHLDSGSRAGAYNATIVSNHFRNATGIRALYNRTGDLDSCIGCHENVSIMLVPNNDKDAGSFEGDTINGNGGNTSAYHYAANMQSFGRTKGSYDYCIYCHRNLTGQFNRTFIYSSNSSISNHSARYNSSNPSCGLIQCHNSTGETLHGRSLTVPGTGYNSTYCLGCHGSNATTGAANYSGITTGTKSRHNNSIDCEECHLNDGRDIHPVKYLQPEGTYNSSNSTATNCVLCHQTGISGFQNAPRISSRMQHSDNISNGSRWNMNEPYWTNTSQQSMCDYCHGDSRHDEKALGRPANWSGLNTVNSSITNSSSWCSGCHYQGYSSSAKNYNDMVMRFGLDNLPVPPEITNHSSYAPYSRNGYFNHTITPDYSDSTCKTCHGVFLPNGTGMDGFMHNVSAGTGTCTDCHFSYSFMSSSGAAARFVNQSMYNDSAHGSLECEDCHTEGHKNIGARKACEDCHSYQQDPVNDRDRHNITGTPSQNVVNNTDCISCHDAGLYNNATAQYGYGKTYDCDYCHTYPDKTYS